MSPSTKKPPIHPDYLDWWSKLAAMGFKDLVSCEDGFRQELIFDKKWERHAATGVYSWISKNGEAYTGKALHVRRRLRDHFRNHPDLMYACFLPVNEFELDAVEQRLIKQVESCFPVRNIKHAESSVSMVPLDHVVSVKDQEAFLTSAPVDGQIAWNSWPLLERKSSRKHERLLEHPQAQLIVGCLNLYIRACIPKPEDTEVNFWSVSLLLQKWPRHVLRVNAGQQEVFTIGGDFGEWEGAQNGQLFARPLALENLDSNSTGPHYEMGSWDTMVPLEQFGGWFNEYRTTLCRQLVLKLMRHTTTLNSGNHCPQVIRQINV